MRKALLHSTLFGVLSVILVALAQSQWAQPEKGAVPASVSEIVSASARTERGRPRISRHSRY